MNCRSWSTKIIITLAFQVIAFQVIALSKHKKKQLCIKLRNEKWIMIILNESGL